MRKIRKSIQLLSKNSSPDSNNRDIFPDIALLVLESPFEINEHVKPACLPNKPIPPGTKCYLSGWGQTYDPKKQRNFPLQYAEVHTISKELCHAKLPKGSIVEDYELCTFDEERGKKKGPCYGDSGESMDYE